MNVIADHRARKLVVLDDASCRGKVVEPDLQMDYEASD